MSQKLNAETIKSTLKQECNLEIDVVVHDSIDSSNSWSMRQCRAGRPPPFVCFAEEQTQGRGRRGKSWVSLPNASIAMSLSWLSPVSSRALNLLPIAIAMAIVQTLENFGLKDVKIKWPNDIYIGDKKIAGILIETQPLKQTYQDTKEKALALIIGVGLNYDLSSCEEGAAATELAGLPPYTDVCSVIEAMQKNETAAMPLPERQQLAQCLLQKLVELCQTFPGAASPSLNLFRKSYDYCMNKHVDIVLDDTTRVDGIALGVNDSGELLVLVDGEQRAFNSADVSVRTDVIGKTK